MKNDSGALLFGLLALIIFLVVLGPIITQWAWAHFMTTVFGMRGLSWVEAFAFGMLAAMFRGSSFKSSK